MESMFAAQFLGRRYESNDRGRRRQNNQTARGSKDRSPSPVPMATYNVVLLGATGVGKSALALQRVESFFEEDHDPTICDTYRRRVVVDGVPCLVSIEDTAGDQEFVKMRNDAIRGGDGFMIVFPITSAEWLDNIRYYRNVIRCLQKSPKPKHAAPIMLVISKFDSLQSNWKFGTKDVLAVAEEMGVTVVETSALTRYGVEYAFDTLVREIRADKERKLMASKAKGWRRVRRWFRFLK